MLFQKGRGPYGSLGDWMALDTADADPDRYTHLLIHLALLDISIILDGHVTPFLQGHGRRRAALLAHTCAH
jgi:hypothetical protein